MESKIPMPQVFSIENKEIKNLIKESLLKLTPDKVSEEIYCDYVMTFTNGKNRLLVKQYQSGKLVVQGKNEEKLSLVLEVINKFSKRNETKEQAVEEEILPKIIMPVIGTDESGKGDYFGPLIVCAMWADEEIERELIELGVKDSKTISDVKCEKLAKIIREKYPDKFVEIALLPPEYNEVYARFKGKGKSLNQLLGYLHAQAINRLFSKNGANTIVVDKFGKESDVQSYLDNSIDKKKVNQIVRGERNPVVAAASILARDRFVEEMKSMSKELEIEFPLGAGPGVLNCAKKIVANKGEEYLRRCAKVHFVVTEQAIKKNI